VNEQDVIKDTVEDLTERIEKSKEESKRLRNLYEELKSKITVENSWRRYLIYKLNKLKESEQSNATN
jgi:hypothetical protein